MGEEEKPEYFYRLIYLVVDLGTETLCEVFKKNIPKEQNIESYLISKKSAIEKMKFLNTMQLTILTANPPEVSKFDISVLYVLIRNLTSVQPPNGGWKIDYPESSDKSPGAYLVRLKSVRNGVIAHKARGRLTESEFEKRWAETEDVLLELAGYVSKEVKEKMKQKIGEAKIKQLIDQPQIDEQLEKLFKWHVEEIEKDHQETKRRLEELENKVIVQEGQQEEINSLKASIRQMQRQLKLVGLEAEPTSADHGGPSASETDGMNRDLEQIGSLVYQVLTTSGMNLLIRRGAESSVQPELPEPRIDNPNALTDEEIREYSKEVVKDWAIFGIYLGYRQGQLDELEQTYPRQIRKVVHEMFKEWHNVVARCDENPRELLAAAFTGIRDNRTAAKILGGKELVEGVKKLKPTSATERKIQEIEFQNSSTTSTHAVSVHLHGNLYIQNPQNQ